MAPHDCCLSLNVYQIHMCMKHLNLYNFSLPYLFLFGGVSALTDKHMKKVNGFSNNYWGWGGEDDDMSAR